MQLVRGTREVPLFGQNNDCVQVTRFNVGEHWSRPVHELGGTGCFVLQFVCEATTSFLASFLGFVPNVVSCKIRISVDLRQISGKSRQAQICTAWLHFGSNKED